MKFYSLLCALLCLTATAPAGSLTPPGAPAPTMKTLDEIEARTPISPTDIPFTITQPGSYYLTGNIHTAGGPITPIFVDSPYVEIDLNGFTITGRGPLAIAGDGINCRSLTTGTVVIRNGTIRDFGNHGINARNATEIRISDITSAANRNYGILMLDGSVTNCTFRDNGISGVLTYGGKISDCTFHGGRFGVVGGATGDYSGGEISNNVFRLNTDYGIRINDGAFHIDRNRLTGPGSGIGLYVQSHGCLITRNVITGHPTASQLTSFVTAAPFVNMAGGTMTSSHPWANFYLLHLP